MHIKKTNYGAHIIHGHDVDICITSQDIQVFYDREIVTLLKDGKAVVSIHDVKIKDIKSEITIEVAK